MKKQIKQTVSTKVIIRVEQKELSYDDIIKVWINGKRLKNPVVYVTTIRPTCKY